MSGIILRIEKQSTQSRRFLIYMEGMEPFLVHEEVLIKYRLRKGAILTEQQLQHITEEEERNQVLQSALRYIGYRPRTRFEIRKHLASKEFEIPLIEQVIQELVDWGYVNDDQYAQQWVEERMHHKGYGRGRLRAELQRKGITDSSIEKALAQVDEEEENRLAMEIAERRYLALQPNSWPTIERRLGAYLMRRGYHSEVIYSILSGLRVRHQAKREDG